MEENKNNPEVIDLREVFYTLWSKKKLFIKVWIVTFVLACAYILPIPRTYTSELSLAPELGGQMTGGGLASLAGSFGIDLSSMQAEDAFYPLLYPDVVSSNEFVVRLFDVRVKSLDGEIDTDYYTYLTQHQKETFYRVPINWVKRQIKNLFEAKEERPSSGDGKINPFMMTETQGKVAKAVCANISCDVDIKTNVITISVVDQDPLICATMCDSVRVLLQDFITKYRTNKASIDVEHYQTLLDEAEQKYNESVDAYSAYCDAHTNSILQSYLSERDKLENDMAVKLNIYNTMNSQLQAVKAKLQERTPSFTQLRGASVPIKATGPKRMIFVAAMLFLAFWGTCLYIYRKEIIEQLVNPASKKS